MKNLYGIWDKVAEAYVGGIYSLMTFPHDAPAVRMFNDVAGNPQTDIGRHVDDFELRFVGVITEEGVLHGENPRVVITGTAFRQAQEAAAEAAEAK